MKEGQLIAVHGDIYEYVGYDESCDLHKVSEIDIDEEGNLISTYETFYFTTQELRDNKVSFDEKQWHGIVSTILRSTYELGNEEIDEATEDIVGRCFRINMPNFNDIEEYIADYMNR